MKIAIRVDASLRIGTGHFARCLTLANALHVLRGAEVVFVCRHATDHMRAQIAQAGHRLAMLKERPKASDTDLAHATWLGTSQTVDAADTLAVLSGTVCDWLVVDHYALDARWESILRPAAIRMMALDDIADRAHDVDLLLDQNLQSADQDRYAGLLPAACRRLIGPLFAVLRPEFQLLAAAPPAVRNRVNIFFGGTDPDGMTVRAVEAFDRATLRDIAMDIIVGISNPHRGRIAALAEKLPKARLHVQPPDMGALMSHARLALGAGGATSWERCCLGVPTAIISIADNQESGCRALARARAAFYLGRMAQVTADGIGGAVQNLLNSPRLLAAMSRRAAALVDGRGVNRVVEAMECA